MGEKAVLDTNILISGLLWQGSPGEILDLVLDGHLEMAISVEQLLELRRVLAREKFGLPEDVQDRALATIVDMSRVIPLTHVDKVIVADPSDDIILATAVATNAAYLITGDQHLLTLGTHKGIRIMTPAAFIAYWRTRTRKG